MQRMNKDISLLVELSTQTHGYSIQIFVCLLLTTWFKQSGRAVCEARLARCYDNCKSTASIFTAS